MTQPRDNDNAIIDEAGELPAPAHQGSGGGDVARKVGQRDEAKTATGGDAEPTKVAKADKREQGDMPSPPQGGPR